MRRYVVAFVLALVPSVTLAAPPVCALLDPEKVPLAALLEAKLSADATSTWVERAGIDKVLQEQKLQALFAPQGVGDRVKLGKLFKADVLVMVRPVKDAKEPVLEVVVSETAGGLRLLVRAVPVTKDTNADVAELLAAVKRGLLKHGEEVTEVVAVPPFVSRNLEYSHDHLKGAFAKLAEAEALDRKGVVVVELEEAQALAKELALADPGAKLDRLSPLYLLGEYQHEGKGKDQTVTVKFRAERSGKVVGKVETVVAKPDAAANVVRTWSADVLNALVKDDTPRPLANPKAEAKQLADRAMEFKRLGNWTEALTLIEASFLIDPDQNQLHVAAINVITPQVASQWTRAMQEKIPLEPIAQLYLRGLTHLEAYLAGGGEPFEYRGPGGDNFLLHFLGSANHLLSPGPGTPATRKRLITLQSEQREVLLRIIPIMAKRGKGEERLFIDRVIYHLPLAERYELLEKIIFQLQELPLARSRTVLYAHQGHAYLSNFDEPEFKAFLRRLGAAENAELRAAADELKTKLDTDLKAKPALFTTDHNKPASDPKLIRLESVKLSGTVSEANKLQGLIPCGSELDALWSQRSVYLMKEKGKLITAWRAKNLNSWITTVCYDGRFIWVAVRVHNAAQVLAVIDPVSGKTREFGVDDGLPQPEGLTTTGFSIPTLFVAPLEPGRVGVVGSHGRAWAAVVTCDPTKGNPDVKVILKATEAQDRADRSQWAKTDVAFKPAFLLTINAAPGPNGKPGRRLLVGRGNGNDGTENIDIARHPLVLDPDRGTAEVLNDEFLQCPIQSKFGSASGAIYCSESVSNKESRVFRVAFPAVKKEEIATGLPNDIKLVVVHDGRIHMTTVHVEKDPAVKPDPTSRVNTQWKTICRWWTIGADGKNLRLSADNMPEMQALAVSSHYGLVALVGSRGIGVLHTVEIADPQPKK